MYALKEIENEGLHYIKIYSADRMTEASICLNQGGRLNAYTFKNVQILADFKRSTYNENYSSSILFPFSNRIKDGEYTFKDSKYNLDCNDVDKNNAIHGLVYDQTFVFVKKELTSNYATITLHYKGEGKSKGFPFKFNIELTYTLSKEGICLSIIVTNKDKNTFPFTLGWHPYFKSTDLDHSSINFKSTTKYLYDHQHIISGTTPLDIDMPFRLKGAKLDDGYPLETNDIEFLTPEYGIKITSTSKENFLQLYTPDQPNVIAIEPMTGAADNFNNKIGLQTLDPNDTYHVEWHIATEILNTKIITN